MNQTLEYRSPELLGIPSDVLAQFLKIAEKEKFGLHSVILLRHGKIAMETYFKPYAADRVHVLYSLSKSFTSTAVGFAVQEGLLSIDDRLIDHFPDKLPFEPCEKMKEVKLRHLLSMASGHAVEPPIYGCEDWVKGFLESYIEFEPGTHFTYNSAATYTLSAVVQKVTGMSVLEYLRPRLLEPLEMSKDIWWEKGPINIAFDQTALDICEYIPLKLSKQVAADPSKPPKEEINCGGFGLNVTTRDLAKFGQFYLQRGSWNGKQLLNAAWIDMATSKQIRTDLATNWGGAPDWVEGYGFQFWRCRPEGVYRGDGAFGQLCAVMPKQDAVLVCTANMSDMQKCLNTFWDLVLPVMGEPLEQDPKAEQELLCLCDRMQMPVDIRSDCSDIDVNDITYKLSDNPMEYQTVKAQFSKKQDVLTFGCKAGNFICTVNHGQFTDNRLSAEIPEGATENQIKAMYLDRSAAGGWIDDTTYRLYLYGSYDSTVCILELTFDPKGSWVKLHAVEYGNMKEIDTTVYGIAES